LKKKIYTILSLLGCLFLSNCNKTTTPKTGVIKISFRNVVGTQPILLDGTNFTNPFGEKYSITHLKYYISNICLINNTNKIVEKESYHLIDQNLPTSLSFSFTTEENTFTALQFVIGVDSLRNVSGAQSGALDPLNDMFWTWNSGYIMAKMEGVSPQSNQVGSKIMYHIGGFSGANSVLKTIQLSFPAGKKLLVEQGKINEINLEADLNLWWQNANTIKITELPVCTTPGVMAKKIAENYSNMFSIIEIVNN
jgi:hypothetical protein